VRDLYDIDPALGSAIDKIVEEGDDARQGGDMDGAVSLYQKAWALVPEPKTDWMMPSLWIISSFCSAWFDKGDFEKAKVWAEMLLGLKSDRDTAPAVIMGMVCYELQQYEEAYAHFHAAYGYAKTQAFLGRDKKYLAFYQAERKKSKL